MCETFVFKRAKLPLIAASVLMLLLCCLAPNLTASPLVPGNDDDNHEAKTHFVDDDKEECPRAGFSTIQSAIDAAAFGDVIKVCPGTYDEQLKIAKPLTLVGVKRDGKNLAVVQPSNMVASAMDTFGFNQAAVILVTETSGVTIKNITVDGINNGVKCADTEEQFLGLEGILVLFASAKLDSVVIKNILSAGGCAFGFAIDYQSGDRRAHLTLSDSSIHDYDIAGLFAFGSRNTLHAIGNVITGLGSTSLGQLGIQIFSGTTGVIAENIITNHVFTPCAPEDCAFVSHGIGVFDTADVRIVRNIVGTANTGIFAGIPIAPVNRVNVLENKVFDSQGLNGILVSGENNIVKDNTITNSDNAGIFASSGHNAVRGNTINEAAIGLLVAAGNKLSDNRFFNTAVVQELFDPAAPLTSSQRALTPSATIRPLLGRRLRNPQ
ncbi:MAG TPA: right-handed parallel beta-helix repeat-containing protein [Pyrinomonadaceae bacterium]|nr:right-handed parallel beta-helix repeat-containing protein [Pyrinomonadaceae bacterium]